MNNLKTIFLGGSSGYTGAILVRRLLNAGHKVRAPGTLIYRNDLFLGGNDIDTICNANFTEIEDDLCDIEKLKKIISGCNVIIYLAKESIEHDYKSEYGLFISLVDIAKVSDVERLIYVSSCPQYNTLFTEHLKNNLEDLAVIVVNTSVGCTNPLKQRLEISVNIHTKYSSNKHKIVLHGDKQIDTNTSFSSDFPNKYYARHNSNISNLCINSIVGIYLSLSEQSLKEIQKKIWPHIITYKIFLSRFYIARKFFQKVKKPYITCIKRIFIGHIKFYLYIIKRLFDVSLMMLSVHLWPEQTYKFSTRKLLPDKVRRYPRSSKPAIPYELIESRTSDIPKMKEANIVLRGSSFDIEKLQNLNSPIFLVSFWEPVQTKKDVIYLMGNAKTALRLGKLGLKVIYSEVNTADYNGDISPSDGNHGSLWYEQFIDDNICKRIAILEKVYRFSKPPFPVWAPTGSALPPICALSFFAEKLNIYGWDFYLESSPDTMTYWQLYSNLYKLELDVFRSGNHLESAIINFYYAYHLSKLPNINIYGRLGQLDRHEKLMEKLERILFNV